MHGDAILTFESLEIRCHYSLVVMLKKALGASRSTREGLASRRTPKRGPRRRTSRHLFLFFVLYVILI